MTDKQVQDKPAQGQDKPGQGQGQFNEERSFSGIGGLKPGGQDGGSAGQAPSAQTGDN